VAVSRSEAELIAKETGARLQALPHEDGPQALLNMQRATEDLAAHPRPCTFLAEDGRCSKISASAAPCFGAAACAPGLGQA